MSGRGSNSGSRGRSGSRSSSTPQVPPQLNSRHAAAVRALLASEGPSAPRPSAPLRRTTQSLPGPSDQGRVPDVRMPQMQRPPTPVSATSSDGGSSVPSEPPPSLFYPLMIPAIPETTPEGVPIPEDPEHPRFLTVEQAYVYQPFTGLTLHSARVSSKTKEGSSSATSAAGNKNNV